MPDHLEPPTPDSHRDRIRTLLEPLGARVAAGTHQPLDGCAGAVLAQDLHAPVSLPLFRNSQMDGYAVRSADVAGATAAAPVRLRVVAVVAAGSGGTPPVGAGEAVKIMTGAPVPAGADCVVPVEDTEPDGDGVTVARPRSTGEYVREPGEDVRTGDRVLTVGTRLRARHLAAAASLGVTGLHVRPRPRVAVVATGSELVTQGAIPGPGQIWESNSLALSVAASECGAMVTATMTVDDDEESLRHALDTATSGTDLVLTAGAVSMGDFEVVRRVLEPLDGSWFGHIGMQPGGPQGLATWRDTPVVCLPGNPVSALVSFVVLLRPLLLEAAGVPPIAPVRARLARGVRSPAGRTQYLRGRLLDDRLHDDGPTDVPTVEPVSGPGSHLVASMAAADHLVEIPADVTTLEAGAEVTALPL